MVGKKKDSIYYVYKKPTLDINKKDGNKIYHVNNKAGMVILIGEKSDFATGNIIPRIKKHNVNSKRSIHHKNITILNVYVHNNRVNIFKAKT